MSRFLNPYTDFGFKRLFGEESSKEVCIDFLNALILDENIINILPNKPSKIIDIVYTKNEFFGEIEEDRKIVLDLPCETQSGEKILVEMQQAKQTYFKDRTLFYTSRLIQEQARKRMENSPNKTWDYKLSAVYCISIMDFKFDDQSLEGRVVHNVMLKELEIDVIFYDKIRFIYLELPYFTKELHELTTRSDKWFYLLKNLTRLVDIPNELKDTIFMKLFKQAEISNFNTIQKAQYEESLKHYMDWHNTLKYEVDKEKERGEKELEKEKAKAKKALEKEKEKTKQAKEEVKKMEQEKKQAEQEKKQAEQEKKQAEQEKKQAEQEKKQAEQELAEEEKKMQENLFEMAKSMKLQGVKIEVIMNVTNLTKKQIENL